MMELELMLSVKVGQPTKGLLLLPGERHHSSRPTLSYSTFSNFYGPEKLKFCKNSVLFFFLLFIVSVCHYALFCGHGWM